MTRSGVDVAVLYAATPPATLEGLPLDLVSRIEHLVKRPVQVVVLNTVTDADLLAKKFAAIEICVQELRTLARPAEIVPDVREARFVLHTLQIAIQAAIDVASHIVSDERLGEIISPLVRI
jgi:hypothetical protein